MGLYKFKGLLPKLDKGVFIAPSADVIGDVKLGRNSNVWFNAVVRGDVNKIEIGEGTNVQDLSMLHVTGKDPLIIGNHVTVGHSVILHACTIGSGCLIGMGAKILDGAIIGDNCLVAAGSVVPPGKNYPANSFIMGTPAKVVRELKVEEIQEYSNHFKTYIDLSSEYMKDFEALT